MFGKGRVHSFKVTASDNKTFDLIKREAETKSTGRIEDDTIEPYTESASADSISNFGESVNRKQLDIINATNPPPTNKKHLRPRCDGK